MNPAQLLAHFDRISDAPDAIPRLRQFILDLAVRGKLVEQDLRDEPASELLKRIEDDVRKRKVHSESIESPNAIDIAIKSLPFNVPPSWRWTRLIEIAEVSYGFAFESSRFNSNKVGMPLIRIRDISGTDTQAYYQGEHDPAYVVSKGDYLVGMDGDFNVRRWKGPAALLNQRVMRIKNWRAALVAEFLAIPLQMILDHLHVSTSQTTVKHLSAKQVNGIYLPLPPLAEQHRIVAKVDELMALCDRLAAAQAERESRRNQLVASSLNRLNNGADADAFDDHARFYFNHLPRLTTRTEHIQQLRQTILNLAVCGKLVPQDPNDEPAAEWLKRIRAEKETLVKKGKVKPSMPPFGLAEETMPFRLPINWRWVRFGELIIDADSGWSPKSEGFPRTADNWGVLKVSAVSWDKFLPEENKQLLPGVIPPKAVQVRSGDFLISRANTSELVAKCVVVGDEPRNLILSDKIVRLQIATDCNKKFLSIVNNHAEHARSYYAEEASGTSLSMKNVSRAVIYALVIPLPPLAEQHRIVAKVEELMALCDKLEAQLTTTQTDSRRLLDAVLHQALTA